MNTIIVNFAITYPARVFALAGLALGAVLLAIALPFLASDLPIPKLKIDTDPENMLSATEPARVLNAEKTELFGLHNAIVIAVRNPRTEHGVFTPEALADLKSLTDFAAGLDGVVAADIVAPDTLDTAVRADTGAVTLRPLMAAVPTRQDAATAIRDRALQDPTLRGAFVSRDGRAVTVAIPLVTKRDGHRITKALQGHMDTQTGGNQYSVTGLPVAQSVFGIEMFIQMAVAAPAAMMLIFGLLFVIFRSWSAALVPLAIAMVSSMGAMGALILTGNTVHIMSSMIPIFVMPIAVMDAIHVLSEFADRHDRTQNRKATIQACLQTLWRPMLFTTITTMAGFASLALAPIPPVQVFGLFVALGVFLAWLATVVIVPAALMRLPEAAIARIVRSNRAARPHWTAAVALSHPRWVLAALGIAAVVLFAGLGRIAINDTPMRWFAPSHPVRAAEQVLTEQFAGAHQAYLALEAQPGAFLDPAMLHYAERLADHVIRTGHATKAIALPDLLHAAKGALPATQGETRAILDAFEAEGQTRTLRKLVSVDHDALVIRFHMANGDNLAMRALEQSASGFLAANPAPQALTADWFGLTYLNAVWQDRMVSGMLDALLGSFVAVLILLALLFRSLWWALLSMVPLTFAIGGTYGTIGWLGRDFDMPITVLSTLSLGLAVDFAIHFTSRIRENAGQDMAARLRAVYQEPARAIQRNTVVLGAGFLPLLLSPLIPYRTVGALIPAIMVISAIATLVVLGAILAATQKRRKALVRTGSAVTG